MKTNKPKAEKKLSQIRVSERNARRIKASAVQQDVNMDEMADLVIDRGFASLKS